MESVYLNLLEQVLEGALIFFFLAMSPQLEIIEGEYRVFLATCIFSLMHLLWFM